MLPSRHSARRGLTQVPSGTGHPKPEDASRSLGAAAWDPPSPSHPAPDTGRLWDPGLWGARISGDPNLASRMGTPRQGMVRAEAESAG